MAAEFSIDGGGVFNDIPLDLPEGSWLRVRVSPDEPERDLRIEVRDGALHVWGMWREVETLHRDSNSVAVRTRW